MHLKLLVPKQVPGNDGRLRQYHAGDWVQIENKKIALLWIANSEAVASGAELSNILPVDSGLLITGDAPTPLRQQILETFSTLNIEVGEPSVPFSRTIIWNTRTSITHALFAVGLNRISPPNRWQVSIPLYDYKAIAQQLGDEDDRARTQAIIHDLRVPYYQTDIIFLRRSQTTRDLIELWAEECKHGNEKLAWLRAVYQIKPYLEALPVTWWRKDAHNG